MLMYFKTFNKHIAYNVLSLRCTTLKNSMSFILLGALVDCKLNKQFLLVKILPLESCDAATAVVPITGPAMLKI